MKRILTKNDWLEHKLFVQRYNADYHGDNPNYFEDCADIAAINSNQFHNEKGHLQFFPDTPYWIVLLAVKRGFVNVELDAKETMR